MKKKLLIIIPLTVLLILLTGFAVYVGDYHHADEKALEALRSDDEVTVTEEDFGWLFDGPAKGYALIFYPGGKVEEKAYAPLCRLMAEEALDVYLLTMPFNLAVFGKNKAAEIMEEHPNEYWYLAGHSLGGVMAAQFAAENPEKVQGLVLLASYSTGKLDSSLPVISVYGSEDQVLNRQEYDKNHVNLPASAYELVIAGGNHAQFGSYGFQKGDGQALISSDEQIQSVVRLMKLWLFREN